MQFWCHSHPVTTIIRPYSCPGGTRDICHYKHRREREAITAAFAGWGWGGWDCLFLLLLLLLLLNTEHPIFPSMIKALIWYKRKGWMPYSKSRIYRRYVAVNLLELFRLLMTLTWFDEFLRWRSEKLHKKLCWQIKKDQCFILYYTKKIVVVV